MEKGKEGGVMGTSIIVSTIKIKKTFLREKINVLVNNKGKMTSVCYKEKGSFSNDRKTSD